MAVYRLYLYRHGELAAKMNRHCADDMDALEAARGLCRDYSIEVYLEERLIARVKEGDEPLNVRDRHSG